MTSPVARRPDPCAMVLFGATGDLTHRLVMPALYNLARTGLLPEHFALIGVGRTRQNTTGWRDSLYAALKGFVGNKGSAFNIDRIDDDAWSRLAGSMTYIEGDLAAAPVYDQIKDALATAAHAQSTAGNIIFYLAIADRFFATVVDRLAQAKLSDQSPAPGPWRRVVIEKPFGHSLDSARALNAKILATLHEDQIFRIDHFLGKEAVQSIMAFRFANGMFEPLWNRDRIDHVQITAAETLGVEARGGFYEATGALRDMVPNHALSLLAMVAMEPPVGFDAASIRSKKADVLAAMPTVTPAHAVRGQYRPGSIEGKPVAGYREEPAVAASSNIETYVAIEFAIDNWRWAGVPFYFRTGKRLARRATEIAIRFKQAPYQAFEATPVASLNPNWLVLTIAPDEGISLEFDVKRPGPTMELAPVRMDFRYDDWFPRAPRVGYETLIYDVMIGDQSLFMRADTVEAAWRIVQPVLDSWARDEAACPGYAAGRDGPTAADTLLSKDGGRAWRAITAPEAPSK